MNFLDLFAGIGGFSLGLERAGMECAGHVEREPYCQKILRKHWPDVPLIGDVRDVEGNEFGAVDLVCGGFPCQPFSVAGKREGAEDDRYLWPEMYRVIELLKPSWVVGENVTGIDGLALDRVLSDLEGGGYEVLTFEIPACAVNAPHQRARLWIVAHSGRRWRRESSGKSEKESESFCQTEREEGSLKTRSSGEAISLAESSRQLPDGCQRSGQGRRTESANGGDVGNSERQGQLQQEGTQRKERRRTGDSGWQDCRWVEGWDGKYRRVSQSGIRLLDDGIPERVARLKALGNAVVPQVVERIGIAIVQAEKELANDSAA